MMEEHMVENTFELSEDEMIIASVLPRILGLKAIFEEDLKLQTDVAVGSNGMPVLDGVYEGEHIRFAYFPVGVTADTDRFLLVMRLDAYEASKEDERSVFLDCESYNIGAVFGYAVYNPMNQRVELRAQIPEEGAMNDAEGYQHLLDMFIGSVSELRGEDDTE